MMVPAVQHHQASSTRITVPILWLIPTRQWMHYKMRVPNHIANLRYPAKNEILCWLVAIPINIKRLVRTSLYPCKIDADKIAKLTHISLGKSGICPCCPPRDAHSSTHKSKRFSRGRRWHSDWAAG